MCPEPLQVRCCAVRVKVAGGVRYDRTIISANNSGLAQSLTQTRGPSSDRARWTASHLCPCVQPRRLAQPPPPTPPPPPITAPLAASNPSLQLPHRATAMRCGWLDRLRRCRTEAGAPPASASARIAKKRHRESNIEGAQQITGGSSLDRGAHHPPPAHSTQPTHRHPTQRTTTSHDDHQSHISMACTQRTAHSSQQAHH